MKLELISIPTSLRVIRHYPSRGNKYTLNKNLEGWLQNEVCLVKFRVKLNQLKWVKVKKLKLQKSIFTRLSWFNLALKFNFTKQSSS